MLLDDGVNEMLHKQAIAADVPSRLKPDLRVHGANGANTFDIVLVEATADDRFPMPDLRALGAAHVLFGGKELPGLRRFRHGLVEPVQPLGQLALDERLELAQVLAALFIQADKIQPAAHILVGCDLSMCRIRHCSRPLWCFE